MNALFNRLYSSSLTIVSELLMPVLHQCHYWVQRMTQTFADKQQLPLENIIMEAPLQENCWHNFKMSILWTFCEHSVHSTLKGKLWKSFRTKKKSENIWLITADSIVPSSNFEHINKWNLAQKHEKCFSVMLFGCVSWTILPMGVHKFPTKQTNK